QVSGKGVKYSTVRVLPPGMCLAASSWRAALLGWRLRYCASASPSASARSLLGLTASSMMSLRLLEAVNSLASPGTCQRLAIRWFALCPVLVHIAGRKFRKNGLRRMESDQDPASERVRRLRKQFWILLPIFIAVAGYIVIRLYLADGIKGA